MRPIVVVGGGPAGSTAATLLAQAGLPVILMDRARFPRPKPCGECLNPGAVRQLRALGWSDEIEALDPGRMEGWSLRVAGRSFASRFPDGGCAWGVDRVRFDAALLARACSAGVDVREGWRVTGVTPRTNQSGPRVAYRMPPGDTPSPSHEMEASFVLAADGLRSTVAASLGLRTAYAGKASRTVHLRSVDLDPTLGHLHLGPGPTVGVAPLNAAGTLWTMTMVRDATDGLGGREDAGPLAATASFPELAGAEVASEAWHSGSFRVELASATAPGVVLLGDAAGYYDPLTGQGIYRALRMAQWACEAVQASLAGNEVETLSRYRTRLRSFAGSRRVQRAIEWVRRHPRVLRPTLSGLGALHGLDHLIAITGDLRSPLSLTER